jgi:hypothetical protein
VVAALLGALLYGHQRHPLGCFLEIHGFVSSLRVMGTRILSLLGLVVAGLLLTLLMSGSVFCLRGSVRGCP